MTDSASHSLPNRGGALLWCALFWVGFFVCLFAAQISGGILGLRGETGTWYGAVLMTVLMLAWTAVLRRLLPAFGVWPALLIIAPVFVTYHIFIGWNPVLAMLGTSAGSMLFGMAAVAARRGLAFPIGVHAGWNFTTWALSGAGGAGIGKMTIPGGMTDQVQTMGMAAYLVCMGLATAALWIWNRMKP